jgi:hypothetical protein
VPHQGVHGVDSCAPSMDPHWDSFITVWTMNVSHSLRVPLKGSAHNFATTKKELVDSLTPGSDAFHLNLSKLVFIVEYLPRHRGRLSLWGEDFHEVLPHGVENRCSVPNLSRGSILVSTCWGTNGMGRNTIPCPSLSITNFGCGENLSKIYPPAHLPKAPLPVPP